MKKSNFKIQDFEGSELNLLERMQLFNASEEEKMNRIHAWIFFFSLDAILLGCIEYLHLIGKI